MGGGAGGWMQQLEGKVRKSILRWMVELLLEKQSHWV